ncbi:MAG: glycerol-3-phosphate acyltransferase [Lachnospiraceae bacterium]|nr:glycerol-3-phosphate acyltransferase [Lachnospiraceae bacterium]
MIRLLCLAMGYAFGLFQTAYFLGKSKGIDIRTQGSGNAGTTNTLRVLGTKAGLIVFVGDVLKCFLVCMITRFAIMPKYPDLGYLLILYTAAGAILGHNFPFYMNFKGGKGMACTAGMIHAFHWTFLPVGWAVFLGIFLTTHYVSLGSLTVYVVLLLQLIIEGQLGVFGLSQPVLIEMYVIMALLAALCFYQHRTNIVRLAKGEERKTYLSKKNQK